MKFSRELERETFRLIQIRPKDHIVFPAEEYIHGRVVVYRDNLAKTLHRYLWEGAFGQLPTTVFLQRTCSEPRCVNPHHYEETKRTRPLATQCRKGHRYTKGNTRTDRRGVRHCVTCERDRRAKRRKTGRANGFCRKAGHKLTAENTYNDGRCKICKREYERERRANA